MRTMNFNCWVEALQDTWVGPAAGSLGSTEDSEGGPLAMAGRGYSLPDSQKELEAWIVSASSEF